MLVQITTRIIQEQALIIGPIAWEEAQQIEGLAVDIKIHKISFIVTNTKSREEVVNKLVKRYEQLFGRASVEVCRDAVKDLIVDTPAEQIPSLLR